MEEKFCGRVPSAPVHDPESRQLEGGSRCAISDVTMRYDAIFKAIEELSVRLILGNILYANTIEGGIILKDFVAMFYFSNTYIAQ